MKSKTRNSLYTKQYNRKLILRMIQRQPISRAEIARQTGLTRAAITIIIDELLSEGIVEKSGTGVADMGRKPVLLKINPNYYHAIGLNLSRDGCTIGLVNIGGETIYKSDVDISPAKDAKSAIKTICGHINIINKNAEAEGKNILGVGISAPGPIDVVNGKIINPPNFEMWNNVDIVNHISEYIPLKTILNNNSSARALLEKYYFSGKKYDDFILLVIESGIGSAVVIDSKIYRGFGGFASEIGHSSINAMGELCNCGNHGCLELYASIPRIMKDAEKSCKEKISSWSDIVDLAKSGSNECIAIVEKEAEYLSAGIVNAINIFHIENIIITGYVSYKNELLKSYINEFVNSRIMNRGSASVNIAFSEANYSDVMAAATIFFDALVF